MDNLILNAPYIYLQKPNNFVYNVYVIVAVRSGQAVSFSHKKLDNICMVEATVSGESNREEIVYFNYRTSFDFSNHMEEFNPFTTELNTKVYYLKRDLQMTREITFFCRDADNSSPTWQESNFALNRPYLYLSEIVATTLENKKAYLPKLLIPVKKNRFDGEEYTLQTNGRSGIVETSINLVKDRSKNRIEILTNFRVNTIEFRDEAEVDGFFTVIVNSIDFAASVPDSFSESPMPSEGSQIPISYAATPPPQDDGSEVKVRTKGASSTSTTGLFIDDPI